MQGEFNKKKIIRIAVIAGVVVIVLAGGGTVIAGKVKNRTAVESVADTNRSYEVKTGTISTTVSGTGTLAADDVQDIDVLSLLTVDKVYVEAGDTVKAGDLLATVDTVSVKTALQEDGNKTTVYTTYDASTGTYGGETEVTTGVSDGTSVEIVSGLSEGDTVYYSYTESSSDTMGFGMDMGNMQMPGGGAPDGQDRSGGKGSGNGPQGGPGGGNRQ